MGRKLLLTSFIIAISIEFSHAQIIKSIGLRVGLATNNANVREKGNVDKEGKGSFDRTTLYPEIQLEILPKKQFSLLVNTAYVSKGFNYRGSTGGGFGIGLGSYKIKAPADYLNLTIAPRFSHEGNGITLYSFIGAYAGFLIAYDKYYYHKVSNVPGSGIVEREDCVLNSKVFGGTIGGGLEFKIKGSPQYFSLQIQYTQDFTKAADYSGDNYYFLAGWPEKHTIKMENRTVLFSVGFHYPFSSGFNNI